MRTPRAHAPRAYSRPRIQCPSTSASIHLNFINDVTPKQKLLDSHTHDKSLKMSHCHDEHDHHGHDHSEGAAHDHTDDLTPALQNHIYEQIDFSAINTLNESEPRAGSKIVQKTWTERLEAEPELKSDADEQLLMHVP